MVGASAAASAAAAQGERNRRRAQNPFVEYEDRELRLQWERQWLQEDILYLTERREDMRFNMVQRNLDVKCITSDRMFENAVIYNDYSHYIRISTALKEELRRTKQEDGVLRALALPKIQRLKSALEKTSGSTEAGGVLRRKQRERAVTAPCVKSLQGLQQQLQESHERLEQEEEQQHTRRHWLQMEPLELLRAKSVKTKKTKGVTF